MKKRFISKNKAIFSSIFIIINSSSVAPIFSHGGSQLMVRIGPGQTNPCPLSYPGGVFYLILISHFRDLLKEGAISTRGLWCSVFHGAFPGRRQVRRPGGQLSRPGSCHRQSVADRRGGRTCLPVALPKLHFSELMEQEGFSGDTQLNFGQTKKHGRH